MGTIVRARLGDQVLDRLVDPLLGGIHAGRCDDLSAQALAPQLLAALATGKGLVRGLRAAGPAAEGPAFVTLRGGLGTLVRALSARLDAGGAVVRLRAPVHALDLAEPERLTVRPGDGGELDAAACVIAAPAGPAAAILAGSAPAATAELDGIAYAGAAIVALAYPPEALAGLPPGTGFVTAGDERLVRACTWASAKWRHLDGDPAIVKAFVGRAGSPPPDAGDGELAALVHEELARALDLRHAPVEWRTCSASARRSRSTRSATSAASRASRRRCLRTSRWPVRRIAAQGWPRASGPAGRALTACSAISASPRKNHHLR